MPDPDQTSKDPLINRLNELESLLERKALNRDAKPQNSIPVLDEIVTQEDCLEDEHIALAETGSETGKSEKTLNTTGAGTVLKRKSKNSIIEQAGKQSDRLATPKQK